ncbi:MAG: response regulator transcription factor [Gammaproteobacteria bacterium]|nr:response regulator transcription factor [Gammaproteobacteria bacterium]MBU1775458.1 response regulator transcription factor [Gammaproteobacteria bacterium]MBU1969786.1 response regulator transcription factor [Gammaproteobacteria bacterium]
MKILIADDHALYRGALAQIVQQLAEGVTALEAHDWNSALELGLQHSDLSLAVLDLSMPDMESFEGLERFLECAQFTPVVVVSASESVQDMRRALDAGAMGYIAKSESTPILLRALGLVLSGGIYIPPRLLQSRPVVPPKNNAAMPRELTPQQVKVLRAIAQGKSNKEIAQEMGLSVATIKAHTGAIFKTLNVSKRFEAIRTAESIGLFAD